MKILSLDDAIKAVTMLLDYEDDMDLIWSCDIINNLKNAPSVTDVEPIQKWISVKDRLPESSGYYLVLGNNGDAFTAEYNSCADEPDKCWGWWREYFDGETFASVGPEFEHAYGVTHWMPLPQAPKESNFDE